MAHNSSFTKFHLNGAYKIDLSYMHQDTSLEFFKLQFMVLSLKHLITKESLQTRMEYVESYIMPLQFQHRKVPPVSTVAG